MKYETEGEQKTQLSMEINFVSAKDSDEIRTMHTKSDNIDILMGSETNDVTPFFINSQKLKQSPRKSLIC